MKVRAYQAGDRDELERLVRALFPDAADDECHALLSRRATTAIFVIDRGDGRLGGYVEAGTRPYADGCDTSPVAYVEAWFVDADLRRSGCGGRLIAAVEDWARAAGLRELASDALIDNEMSITAHKALGFTEHERHVCFGKKL